jgi:hypothetical protein
MQIVDCIDYLYQDKKGLTVVNIYLFENTVKTRVFFRIYILYVCINYYRDY